MMVARHQISHAILRPRFVLPALDPDYLSSIDISMQVSACCGAGSRCATNIYCVGSSGDILLVGTCTDRKFKDAACPWPLSLYSYLIDPIQGPSEASKY